MTSRLLAFMFPMWLAGVSIMHRIRHTASTCSAAILFLVVFFPATPVRGDDWPTYRHDRLRSGVTGEQLALPLKGGWTFRSRQSRRAPTPKLGPQQDGFPECSAFTLPMIAVGDAVFFTSASDGRVVCLDAATGQTRWEFFAGAAVNRAPMFWKGRIYAGSDDGHAYCLDAASGDLVWKFRAAPAERSLLAYGKMISAWPVRTDVLVDDGVAYFSVGIFPHEGTFVYAIDAETGKLLWRNGTQSEDGGQLSLAPGGHLFLTGKDIWIPKDFRGFSRPYYGSPTPFLRADGRFVNGFGSSVEQDPERPKIEGGTWHKFFWPMIGVEKDGVRFAGSHAWQVEGEEKSRKVVWQHEIPGRWVDFESGAGTRVKGEPVVFRYDPDLCSVICAGDTLFHSAFDLDPAKGVGSGVYARDPKDGKVLWSTEIATRANQLVVANGRLFVGTRSGTIHCFTSAAAGTKVVGEIVEPVTDKDFAGGNELAFAAAEAIIAETGVVEGYAVVLDCDSGQLAFELAKRSKLTICSIFSDEEKAAEARRKYAGADQHVTRIVALACEPGEPLPLPSFFADLVVSEAGLPEGELERWSRLQKPVRGVAFFGGEGTADWIGRSGQEGWSTVSAGGGTWAKRTRPRLEDGGAWTHMHGDAGNTGCSHDGVLKPPLGVVWFGPPNVKQPGGHTALLVDGIMILPEPNALKACDQYTGRALWQIDAGSIGVSIAASRTHVYSKVAHVLAQIDILTGKERASYLTAFGKEHPWGWFALSDDGKNVYGAAGGGIFASEMESGKGDVRWSIGGPDVEEKDRIGGTIAMSGGRIFVLGGEADEDQRADSVAQMRAWMKTQPVALRDEYESQIKERDIRELIAIEAASGKILYRRGVDVSNCGGKWLRPQGYGSKRHYNPHVGMGMYSHNGVVVIASESRADKGWGVWGSDGYMARGMTGYDAESGGLLWYQFSNHRTRPVIIDNTVHAEPWAFDLQTGMKKTRTHPITGVSADWAWCRPDKQCGIFSASKYFLFGRNKGFGYQDLINDEGLYTFWHSRSNCYVDHVSGGGLMIKPPQAIYCSCEWSLPFTVAMGQVSTRPAAAPRFAQPGASLPVRHLYLDFGASGDRRDESGRLWLASNRPENHKLLLGYDLKMITHEGGGEVRRSAHFTAIENADAPFVFATALVGMKRCILPLARSGDRSPNCKVRLGFAAPPGDRPGQRVFDVVLNGAVVLENFDIVAEAGGVDRALWKEFPIPNVENLVIDMRPKSAALPTINALEINRQPDPVAMGIAVTPTTEGVWLSQSAAQKSISFQIFNRGDQTFTGSIEIEYPPGISAKLEGAAECSLAAGARETRSLVVEPREGVAIGVHRVAISILDADGNSAESEELPVEWLGEAERRVLTGGSACLTQDVLKESWPKLVKPNHAWERLFVSGGFAKQGDGGAAASYLWFHIPAEIRGKTIRSARVQLHAATGTSRLFETMRTASSGGAEARHWGRLRRLEGPPWPDFNKLDFANHPQPTGEAVALSADPRGGGIVAATLPGTIEASNEKPDIYLAIESDAPCSAVYSGHGAPAGELRRPSLILDFLPE